MAFSKLDSTYEKLREMHSAGRAELSIGTGSSFNFVLLKW